MSTQPQDSQAAERDFYRQQLSLAFQHSRPFYEPIGTVAEEVVDTPAFAAVLAECAPGSLEAARRMGEMVVVLLSRVPTIALPRQQQIQHSPGSEHGGPGPWWRDLLNYERACFLQLATTAVAAPANRPRRGVSTLCMTFAWQVPALIERLKQGAAVTEDLHQPLTLLFARQSEGKLCVVEVGPNVEKVFRATNGLRTAEQIASVAGVSLEQTAQQLEALSSIGAVVPAMSPEEMIRQINAREQR
jgi:hypothetical protein